MASFLISTKGIKNLTLFRINLKTIMYHVLSEKKCTLSSVFQTGFPDRPEKKIESSWKNLKIKLNDCHKYIDYFNTKIKN